MKHTGTEIIIASVPDREEAVAEIWFGEAQFAELRREGDTFLIEIYKPPGIQPWLIGQQDLMAAIVTAKKRLLGVA